AAEDGSGVAEVDIGESLRTKRIQGGNGEEGGADSVAADIQQIEGEVLGVDPVVPEGIASQLSCRHVTPGGADVSVLDRFRQKGNDIAQGAVEIVGELLLALLERFEGLIALEEVDVSARVVADAGDQLDAVGELDEIVVGAEAEGLRLGG